MNKLLTQLNNTTWKIGDTIIGDDKQKEFYPQMKITKWDNECNTIPRIVDTFAGKATVTQISDTEIEWKKPDARIRIYPEVKQFKDNFGNVTREFDSMEYDLELYKAPLNDEVRLTLVDKNVYYSRQTPLTTLERMSMRYDRPYEYDGAYVVFHKHRGIVHRGKDAEKYKCSKAGVYLFPYFEDALGVRRRAKDFRIENGEMIITLPKDIKYPIRKASGLQFGSDITPGTGQTIYWNVYALLATGVVGAGIKVTVYNKYDNAILASRCVLFEGASSTTPVANTETVELTGVTGTAWRDYAFATRPTLAAIDYKIAFTAPWMEISKVYNYVSCYYDVDSGSNKGYSTTDNVRYYTSPPAAFPFIAAWQAAGTEWRFGMYVTLIDKIKLSGLTMSGLTIK